MRRAPWTIVCALGGAVLGGGACFAPELPAISCDPQTGCPTGLVCVDNQCRQPGGGGGGGFTMLIDDADEFAEGSYTDASHDGVGVVPTAAAGRWTSAIIDAGETTTWNSFSWRPSASYGSPLPPNRAIETGYSGINLDMTETLLLLECASQGAAFVDLSGNDIEIHPTSDNDSLKTGDGIIDSGCLIGTGNHFGARMGDQLSVGTGDFTWAFWIKTTTECLDNDVFIGADADPSGPNEVQGSHQWVGCARADDNFPSPACEAAVTGGLAGNQLSDQAKSNGGICNSATVNDGQWHHVAVTKRGHTEAELAMYLDGVPLTNFEVAYDIPFAYPEGASLFFGSFPEPGETAGESSIDEVLILGRALDSEEVRTLFHRGGSRVSLRVRSCDDPACDDEVFTDAGGDDASITDTGLLTAPTPIDLQIEPGRYFQVRIDYESSSSLARPRVESVSFAGVR